MSRVVCFVLLTLTAFQSSFSQGCAMCKAAVENSDQGTGFNEAILYLMMFPYIIGLVAFFLIFYLRKRKNN